MLNYFTMLVGAIVCFASTTSAGSRKGVPTEYEQLYKQLVNLTTDDSKVAEVSNLALVREAGVFHLQSGQLHATTPIDGRMVAVVFMGKGTFSLKPPTRIEREQLYRFYESDSIEMKFESLTLFFSDTTWEELENKLSFRPGDGGKANDQLKYCIKYLNDDDGETFHPDFMYSFLHKDRNALFYAHFSDQQIKPFFFEVNPFEEEEVSFSERGPAMTTHYQERVTQFHTLREYKNGTAGNTEKKDLIRISDFKINATIETNLDFKATTTLIFRSRVDNLRWFPLSLYDRLDVDSVYMNSQGAVPFYRGDKSYALWIQAPRPLAISEPCTLMVRYNGDMLEKDELGWIGLRSSANWYPRVGGRNRSNFELTFHTPVDYLFMSVGKKEFEERAGEVVVSRWKTIRPAHNVSFSLGSFEEVVLDEDELAAERQPGKWQPNVKVYRFEYAPKGFGISDLAEDVRRDIMNSMKFFDHLYGESPVNDFYASEVPYSHGLAFPGLVHLSWSTYMLFDSKGSNEIFRAHEVAHQWWGVGVNFATYHDQWLSEAFSQYSGLWFMQSALHDNKKFFDELDRMKEKILGARKYIFGSGQESGPIWLGYRTHSSNTKGDYDLIVYDKGAWVLHMLRNMMLNLQNFNEDGFKNMMREFYSLYLGKEASTADFQRVVEKHMGGKMDWFFNQWLMDTKIPEYKFAYKATPTPEGQFKTVCRVLQENVPKEFMMPIPLLIKFDDDKYVRVRLVVSGEKEDYEIMLPLEPKEIVFNDLHSVLCEVDYMDWE